MNKVSEKILSATIKLFIRDNVRKITMDDIADYSAVSKVTIYKYFHDKDALYLEICRSIFSEYVARLEKIAASEDALERRLLNYLGVLSEFIDSGRYDLCGELARCSESIESEYELYRKAYRRTMLSLVDEGLQTGMIKSALDRDMVFHYVDMGVAHYRQSREYRSRMANDEAFRQRFLLFYVGNIFVDGQSLLSQK